MGIFSFQKRDLDWWLFTLLPIFLVFIILIFSSLIGTLNYQKFIFLFGQQLLFFSIILGVTDLGIKAKNKIENIQISPSFYALLISIFSLLLAYTKGEALANASIYLILFFIVAIFLIYVSILFYNKNPLTSPLGIGAREFTESKEKQEKNKEKEFKSPQKKPKYKDTKWGKNNE